MVRDGFPHRTTKPFTPRKRDPYTTNLAKRTRAGSDKKAWRQTEGPRSGTGTEGTDDLLAALRSAMLASCDKLRLASTS